MAAAADLRHLRSLVFSSVFPVSSQTHSTPTQAFAHHSSNLDGSDVDHAAQQEHYDTFWLLATDYLGLERTLTGGETPKPDKDVEAALRYLLTGDGQYAAAGGREDLIDWYTVEIEEHFIENVRPALKEKWENSTTAITATKLLEETAQMLHHVQSRYFQPLNDAVLPIIEQTALDDRAAKVNAKFRRDIHAIVAHSIPAHLFQGALCSVLFDTGCQVFGMEQYAPEKTELSRHDTRSVHRNMRKLLQSLQEVGLGGDQAQRALGYAMHRLVDTFISSHYMKVDWFERRPVVKTLRDWIRQGFSPFVKEAMECLSGDAGQFQPAEVNTWVEMAVDRLGRARVDNLFDYVVNWDRSLGAILDLKEYITTPAAKNHLTQSFLKQVSRRLLHAGATTTHILDVYIYVIRAFTELDPKAILLEKVARPIRRYLREREDTARVIVSSLLADVQDEHENRIDPGPDVSVEIALEMLNPIAANPDEQDQDLDWGNMDWIPDPVDASPEYRKTKSENVLAYLLSLYDREDFIVELKNILGEHLLRNEDSEFEKEIRLLELFKLRLGDDKLQACEVMLKDALESKRINNQINHLIRHTPLSPPDALFTRRTSTQLNAQILSAFFWPSLREDTFEVPVPIDKLMKEYEAGFEGIKDMRKLHWLPALGRVSVDLEFEDRKVEVEVLPWQASVIWAFQEEKQPVSKTVDSLVVSLAMDESLVRNALTFWVGQLVLHETSKDTYTVLETLSSSTSTNLAADAAAAAEAAAESAEATAAVKSAEDVLMENMGMYRQFVLGMLTNQGRMDKGRVCGMLKMALAGGFPWGVDEVGVLLGRMVEEGVLVETGDGGFAVKT
ncbi:hypothetical protein K490DRAFT_48953 [Saccharata proteae CBS 121410]|uniref:Anaphase-promoting complex subunit 2 n=1 Tax=Saccharata proteae CBS 121410 TaxID=1314787 RepID=A0A9P4LU60_9PEZI|nr:hypothetical protein K490DRAFT_48953 [Saccharata proteae CBS 121410]